MGSQQRPGQDLNTSLPALSVGWRPLPGLGPAQPLVTCCLSWGEPIPRSSSTAQIIGRVSGKGRRWAAQLEQADQSLLATPHYPLGKQNASDPASTANWAG